MEETQIITPRYVGKTPRRCSDGGRVVIDPVVMGPGGGGPSTPVGKIKINASIFANAGDDGEGGRIRIEAHLPNANGANGVEINPADAPAVLPDLF